MYVGLLSSSEAVVIALSFILNIESFINNDKLLVDIVRMLIKFSLKIFFICYIFLNYRLLIIWDIGVDNYKSQQRDVYGTSLCKKFQEKKLEQRSQYRKSL